VRRRLTVMALLASGCCFGSAPEVRPSLEGPITAEMVFVQDGYGAVTSRIHVTSPVVAGRIAACGDDPEARLVGDGTADRFAYQCRPGGDWFLLYVGPRFLLDHCSSHLGAGPEPDFARAPQTFIDAAGDIAACSDASPPRDVFYRTFLDEAERLGVDSLVRALVASIQHEGAAGWEEHAARVPADHPFRDQVRAYLGSNALTSFGACRAIGLLGVDDPGVLSRASVLLPDYAHPVCLDQRDQLMAAMVRADPSVVATLACAALTETDGDPGGWTLAPIQQLAASDARCVVEPWIAHLRCRPAMRCGDHLCGPGELEDDFSDPYTMNAYHALLAIAYRNGPLPEEWTRLERCGAWSPEP
jgi:hypothetical protein